MVRLGRSLRFFIQAGLSAKWLLDQHPSCKSLRLKDIEEESYRTARQYNRTTLPMKMKSSNNPLVEPGKHMWMMGSRDW